MRRPPTTCADAARRLVGELNKQQDLLHIMFIELVEFNGAYSATYERIAPQLPQLSAVLSAKAGALRAIPLPPWRACSWGISSVLHHRGR